MPLAHSANEQGIEHDLVKHLESVARRAETFAAKFGAGNLAHWAAICHDLGKFSLDWQRYLSDPDTSHSPGHSALGAVVASDLFGPLAFLVAGHHAGLPGLGDLKLRVKQKAADPALLAVREAAEELLRSPRGAPGENDLPDAARRDPRALEFFLRMTFSALVDADFLDTEEHFEPVRAAQRQASAEIRDLWLRFQEDQSHLTGRGDTAVNIARDDIYHACLSAGELPPGLFSLTAPTGSGKTRSAMAFALCHALRNGLERVIVTLPYTSIVEQTVDEYRGIFGHDAVLEHHSQAELLTDDESEASLRARLATENWDAPVIVTTTVQLFESLFANRPSRCRKLHNLARTVLILDEVQALPAKLLAPIVDVLQQLADDYRVSVVLSTATQPALQDGISQGLSGVREILPDAPRYFEKLRRVEYETHVGEPWTWEQVVEVMRQAPSCLAVVNTKADALRLLGALDDPEALHLSTLLCGAHRREVLGRIKARLSAGEPCRVVSTQVVEAGVDLDFPIVLRAVGPLDSIVQAAGRCNREGRLSSGKVIVFDPKDGTRPRGAYAAGLAIAQAMLKRPDANLHSPELYHEYFRLLFPLVELDAYNIQPLRQQLNYPEVAARFRLIDDDTASVVVRYDGDAGEAARLIGILRASYRSGENARWALRRLQPYLVSVRRRELTKYQQEGLVTPVLADADLWEWLGGYDRVRGLTVSSRDPEDLVI